MNSLKNKVVLVTGGGRGLGAAICQALAKEGARVAVMDLHAETAQAQVAELQQSDCHAYAIRADVGDEAQVKAAISEVVKVFGRLDALVNNAGIDKTCSVDELECDEWDRIIRTNLSGPFMLAKYAARQMREQGGGQIINIASTAARRAWPNAAAYHASKWGLLGLSQALHAELRSERIKVSTVFAGGMRTPFLLDRFPDLDPGLLQDPANVADTVRYLLTLPEETVIAEVMVLPMRETSWP
ncbi:SDR family oxidoreductase [Chitiniphilus purpureus]|uniref:SDR family oxidoreductase n=1 Tax=Chitiniphilus purpureus TaxID=2981137 RepID=A0ABY6DPK3_9NEIS|nr:SDR family oxidoreductase [Chitiniphilus sp. CD1]UXY16310.1 SDR family oxidoreductase [Chitiniphilus sp. CD1]